MTNINFILPDFLSFFLSLECWELIRGLCSMKDFHPTNLFFGVKALPVFFIVFLESESLFVLNQYVTGT